MKEKINKRTTKNSIEEQKIQQAANNILRGEDIESAVYILKKFMFDNVIFIGGRVNPVKIATRQVLNFIEKYQESDYELINRILSNDYIPVQKVKDKIEEIKERKMDIVTSLVHNADEKIEILKKDKIRIQILQELLESEE